MASVEFYDVKTRKKVKIDEGKIKKVKFETKKGQTRYGIQAKTDDGRNLTKFVSKTEWDKLKVPEA
jgi:hypothetical protein